MNMELDYDVLRWDAHDAARTVSYVMPALRGRMTQFAQPVVRFLELPDLEETDFFQVYRKESSAFLRAHSLQEVYAFLSELPPGVTAVGIAGLGILGCGDTVEQADQCLHPGSSSQEAPRKGPPEGRMAGKVAVVTGGAQGLGNRVAEALLREGAYVVLADIQYQLAQQEAERFCSIYGAGRALAQNTDVSVEVSVENACVQAVLHYGGIDVMFSNAGIVIPGSLESLTAKDFVQVFLVNCVGYFHCAKYAARYMKIQRAFAPGYTADIINTSSVAGLIGYPKNSPYCATKFGVRGMTESFAKELLPYGIKVNSICPGNYLDGPLWSHPERGLFKQYLEAGKVPGGKTLEDSVQFYKNREPFKRGMQAEDLAQAVMYCIEQQFETGIALPVTGGLYMGPM